MFPAVLEQQDNNMSRLRSFQALPSALLVNWGQTGLQQVWQLFSSLIWTNQAQGLVTLFEGWDHTGIQLISLVLMDH